MLGTEFKSSEKPSAPSLQEPLPAEPSYCFLLSLFLTVPLDSLYLWAQGTHAIILYLAEQRFLDLSSSGLSVFSFKGSGGHHGALLCCLLEMIFVGLV